MIRPKFDLIKTIDDDEEVTDYSDQSDEEESVSFHVAQLTSLSFVCPTHVCMR